MRIFLTYSFPLKTSFFPPPQTENEELKSCCKWYDTLLALIFVSNSAYSTHVWIVCVCLDSKYKILLSKIASNQILQKKIPQLNVVILQTHIHIIFFPTPPFLSLQCVTIVEAEYLSS